MEVSAGIEVAKPPTPQIELLQHPSTSHTSLPEAETSCPPVN